MNQLTGIVILTAVVAIVLSGEVAYAQQAPINTAQIKDGAVTTRKIKDAAVTTAKIGPSAVTREKIGGLAIGRNQIDDGAVDTGKLNANSVTREKIGPQAVGRDQIGDSAVDTGKLNANSVTREKIGPRAVGRDQIDDGAVDTGKLNANSVTREKIGARAVGRDQIDDGAVDGLKLKAAAVTGDKIANDTVDATKIKLGSITADRLAPGVRPLACTFTFLTPTGPMHYGPGGVVVAGPAPMDGYPTCVPAGAPVMPQSVTGTQIANETIDATKIKPGSITGDRLAPGTLTLQSCAKTFVGPQGPMHFGPGGEMLLGAGLDDYPNCAPTMVTSIAPPRAGIAGWDAGQSSITIPMQPSPQPYVFTASITHASAGIIASAGTCTYLNIDPSTANQIRLTLRRCDTGTEVPAAKTFAVSWIAIPDQQW